MRKLYWPLGLGTLFFLAIGMALLGGRNASGAAPKSRDTKEPIREIYVPFEDLNVILESKTERVFLTRKEYDELLARAKKAPSDEAPQPLTLLSADYQGEFDDGRVRMRGTLQIEVLSAGLLKLPLPLSGVGVRQATLDGEPAALGRDPGGQVMLFVEGRGRRQLVLDLVIPLQTTAAQQILTFHVPTPPSTRMNVNVPGDVDVKDGVAVARREIADDRSSTRFEWIPSRGPMTIVLSLNNRLLQEQRVVIARSVIVDEITQGYERLHARISLDVLHGAVDQFQFVVPQQFEVTDVVSPLVSQWVVAEDGARRVLTARLREPTSKPMALNISAIRTQVTMDAWVMPRLEPLDVAGHMAVVGMVLEDRLDAQQIGATGLIAIDNAALTNNVPDSVFQAEPGAPQIRPIVTYYAPQAEYQLTASFVKPPPQLRVKTNLLLTLSDKQQEVHGGFSLLPEAEKLFELPFSAPAGWVVTQVTDARQQELRFETYQGDDGSRIRVILPAGIPAGQRSDVFFQAVTTPAGWLGDWNAIDVAFPVFAVQDATRDEGAIAVVAHDDLVARPDELAGLAPIDQHDFAGYGLAGVPTTLAYRYDGQPYAATLAIDRKEPWITAQTYSFFEVEADSLTAHYEIDYLVEQAGTRQLVLRLPADTPTSLSIRALDGVRLKESSSEVVDDARVWTVQLAERRRGRIRLAIDFQQRLENQQPKDYALPLVTADGVAFQNGHVAVEGSAELDVQVKTKAREVDIGELSDADYLPGRRLLGAYAYNGETAQVTIDVFRHPGYGLPSAIVQRAEMVTAVSANGVSQTVARYHLRTKAPFLEVELPAQSELWSALLDGAPIKPQLDNKRLLMSLASKRQNASRDLQVVYETPTESFQLIGDVKLAAPQLFLRAGKNDARTKVPVADIKWDVNMPPGFQLARSTGTVFTQQVTERPSPLASVVRALYVLAGGAHPYYLHLASQEAAQEAYQDGVVLYDQSKSISGSAGVTDAAKSMVVIVMPDPPRALRIMQLASLILKTWRMEKL